MKALFLCSKDNVIKVNDFPEEPNIIDYGEGEYFKREDMYTYDMDDWRESVAVARASAVRVKDQEGAKEIIRNTQLHDLKAGKANHNIIFTIQPDVLYPIRGLAEDSRESEEAEEAIWEEAETYAIGQTTIETLKELSEMEFERQIKVRVWHVIDALKKNYIITRKP